LSRVISSTIPIFANAKQEKYGHVDVVIIVMVRRIACWRWKKILERKRTAGRW